MIITDFTMPGNNFNQRNVVHSADSICRTLIGQGHSGNEPKVIVAMRGRNPDNPSERTAGSPTEQRLEPNRQGICNTITSVQKDNMVLEKQYMGGIYTEVSERFQGGILADMSRCLKSEKHDAGVVEYIKVKQATKEGYIDCKIESRYRIRKLIPRECGRLMDVSDEDIDKMESVNSNSQLYKQYGNSIVKKCLVAIFANMHIQDCSTWDEIKDKY